MATGKRPSQYKQQQGMVQWWEENQTLIQHLNEGRSVRETAEFTGATQRQVTTTKKRLHDLLSARLSHSEVINFLKYMPHPTNERLSETASAFEELMKLVGQDSQDTEGIQDASENLDKYIYGSG